MWHILYYTWYNTFYIGYRPWIYRGITTPCAIPADHANTLYHAYAGFSARAYHAAVSGDGHGLRVRVVPAAPGRQRGTPSPRGRRTRWRRTSRGRSRRRRVQPFMVCAGRLVYAVRQTKSATRRTRVSFNILSIKV